MTAPRPVVLPSPSKVRQYVETVRAASGREVATVRMLPSGGVEVVLEGSAMTVNPADLVRMDD